KRNRAQNDPRPAACAIGGWRISVEWKQHQAEQGKRRPVVHEADDDETCIHRYLPMVKVYSPLTRWVSSDTACHITRYLPAVSGASRGITSCFLSFASMVAVPVGIGLPLSSCNSRPENLATTPSEKFRRISLVPVAARSMPSDAGTEDVS